MIEAFNKDEIGVGAVTNLPDHLAASHWNSITDWKVEPQSDDRPVMVSRVPTSTAPASVQRSTARRIHQAMFKKWSQSRHD